MRICTITCHDVYNHGASMQAYALMRYLEKEGHDVQIIDYKPEYLCDHHKLLTIGNEKWKKNKITQLIYIILKMPERIVSLKRKMVFDKFKKENLKLTDKRYISNEELKKNIPVADVYICGSDQIWNSLHKNGRDEAFYLNFVPKNKIKLSYAASFATDDVEDKYKELVKSNLKSFNGISIREKSGVKIVEKLGFKDAINVVDPVFLLDKKEWDKIATERFDEEYILIYDFDRNTMIKDIAFKMAKKKGYKIYTINACKTKYADRNFNLSGPKTFISLVKNAKLVISNSFHAVVFSVIYNKNIVIVNRNENINTRMRDLLEDLNLSKRMIEKNYNIDELLEDIDFKECNEIIKRKIEISKRYLKEKIKNKENFI